MKAKAKPLVVVCPPDDSPLLNEEQAAAFLGLSKFFIQKNRQGRGKQIPYVRISHRCVRYRKADLMQFALSLRKG